MGRFGTRANTCESRERHEGGSGCSEIGRRTSAVGVPRTPGRVATSGTMKARGNRKIIYSAEVESAEEWTVERHLADKPKAVLDLYTRFVRLIAACGPYTVNVTKTAIAFKGTHRGFAGAKPRKAFLDGFLDLQREVQDERFVRVSPYTRRLYVHQFRIRTVTQLDDSFAALVDEAYQVGRGAHRPPQKGG